MPQHYYQQSSAWNHVNRHTYKKHTGAGFFGALISAIVPHKPKPKPRPQPQEEEGEGFLDDPSFRPPKLPPKIVTREGRGARRKRAILRSKQMQRAREGFILEPVAREGAGLWGDLKQVLKDQKRQFMYKHKLSKEAWESHPGR